MRWVSMEVGGFPDHAAPPTCLSAKYDGASCPIRCSPLRAAEIFVAASFSMASRALAASCRGRLVIADGERLKASLVFGSALELEDHAGRSSTTPGWSRWRWTSPAGDVRDELRGPKGSVEMAILGADTATAMSFSKSSASCGGSEKPKQRDVVLLHGEVGPDLAGLPQAGSGARA